MTPTSRLDVGGQVGEEDVAGAGAPHQTDALAGELLLDELADAASALPLELDVALIATIEPWRTIMSPLSATLSILPFCSFICGGCV